MPDENVEIAGEAIAAWNAGDLLTTADDRVVVHALCRVTGRGPRSDMEFAWVYTIRNRSIIRAEFFAAYEGALEAAGLSGAGR
jgi:ketosteroid isomerase-like protein